MKTATLFRLALPPCIALAGCKEQPVDGAGGAIVKPLGKNDKKKVTDRAELDEKIDVARPVDTPDVSPSTTKIVGPNMTQGTILGPDMIQGGGKIVSPDMIQGSKLPPDKITPTVDAPK